MMLCTFNANAALYGKFVPCSYTCKRYKAVPQHCCLDVWLSKSS